MGFEWRRMENTPEGELGRKELDQRGKENTLEELAKGYDRQSEGLLGGKDGTAARDEIARFAKEVSSTEGPEQYEHLEKLVHALSLRKPSIFSEIPDDAHERTAFALALVRGYEKSLQ